MSVIQIPHSQKIFRRSKGLFHHTVDRSVIQHSQLQLAQPFLQLVYLRPGAAKLFIQFLPGEQVIRIQLQVLLPRLFQFGQPGLQLFLFLCG